MRRQAGWREGGGGKAVQEVCVSVEAGGLSQSLGSTTKMIEMNSAGSLVRGICDVGSTVQSITWSCLD